ncbi:MAG: zinc ribbon domain-containing protein, partial [Fusobacteriaceae bacterium]
LAVYILTSHFLLSFIVGWIAKKYFDRDFLLWTVVGFLVPVISLIALIILGYEGNYCSHCGKKNRKNSEKCSHCGFDIGRFFKEEKNIREIVERWKKK